MMYLALARLSCYVEGEGDGGITWLGLHLDEQFVQQHPCILFITERVQTNELDFFNRLFIVFQPPGIRGDHSNPTL